MLQDFNIFFGALGVHKFVLGRYNNAGIIMLLVGDWPAVSSPCGLATGVMSLIGLIEGVIYLTKTPDEFRETDLDHQQEWF